MYRIPSFCYMLLIAPSPPFHSYLPLSPIKQALNQSAAASLHPHFLTNVPPFPPSTYQEPFYIFYRFSLFYLHFLRFPNSPFFNQSFSKMKSKPVYCIVLCIAMPRQNCTYLLYYWPFTYSYNIFTFFTVITVIQIKTQISKGKVLYVGCRSIYEKCVIEERKSLIQKKNNNGII